MPWGYTIGKLQDLIDSARKIYCESKKGYRASLRGTIQDGSIIVSRLRSNEKLRQQFLDELTSNRTPAKHGEISISLEVMARIVGNNRADRKRASKFGQVIDILEAAEIPPEETAAEIKRRGGIEKIIAANKPHADKENGDDDERQESVRRGGMRSNNRQVSCKVMMRLSDRDAIFEHQNRSILVLTVRRISGTDDDGLVLMRWQKELPPDSSGWTP